MRIKMTAKNAAKHKRTLNKQLEFAERICMHLESIKNLSGVMGSIATDSEVVDEACSYVYSSSSLMVDDIDRVVEILTKSISNLDSAVDAYFNSPPFGKSPH